MELLYYLLLFLYSIETGFGPLWYRYFVYAIRLKYAEIENLSEKNMTEGSEESDNLFLLLIVKLFKTFLKR